MITKAWIILLALGFSKGKEMRFIAVGDWGADRSRQDEVADAMGKWASKHGCDFIISTGDNFYDEGVTSSDDRRFETTWKEVYTHPAIAELTWYISVGNHDHGPSPYDTYREWYQVEHSRLEPRWHMPGLTYSFSLPAASSTVKFIALDTQSIRKDKNNADGMLDYLEEELIKSKEDWKIVFGHHPAFSAGNNAGSGTIRSLVLPILLDYDVDVYLAGHDHNHEHWQTENAPDIDHIVTGGGGRSRYGLDFHNMRKMESLGMELLYFEDVYGFAYFIIDDYEMSIEFVNSDLRVIYQYSRYKD